MCLRESVCVLGGGAEGDTDIIHGVSLRSKILF